MPTPVSSSVSYCSPEMFLQFVDVRLLGDLVGDDGERADADTLLDDPNLQLALDAASGELEMAALVGERYDPEDLQALTGVMAVKLAELVAWIALSKLLSRRQPMALDIPQVEQARAMLQAIHEGGRIFGLVEVQNAHHPKRIDDSSLNVRPTFSDYRRAGRWFGSRSSHVERF